MLEILTQSALTLLSMALALVVPGLVVVRLVDRSKSLFSPIERAVLAVATSIIFTDVVLLSIDAAEVPLGRLTLLCLFGIVAALLAADMVRSGRGGEKRPDATVSIGFVVIVSALLVFKTIFLVPSLLPDSTDLGHHMYWVERIVSEGSIPEYVEREIKRQPDGKYDLADPEPISDFIVGEHLPIAAVGILSGAENSSTYPVLILFLIHVVTAGALYALARRVFAPSASAGTIAIVTIFLFGTLYAIDPPQMKYVVGGVVGNTIGNLLIPTAFLLVTIAYRERRSSVLAMGAIVAVAIAYTHHLSALLFAAAAIGAIVFLLAIGGGEAVRRIRQLVVSAPVLLAIAAPALFLFFVHMPSYLENSAAKTVIGAPEASEHQGYSVSQLASAVGEPRFVLAVLGLALLFASVRMRRSDAAWLLAGWTIPLVAFVLAPDVLRIDLPSGRVANYLVFPVAMLAAYAIVRIANMLRGDPGLRRWIPTIAVVVLVLATSFDGFLDNARYLAGSQERFASVLSLRDVSRYLAARAPEGMRVVHDHINIPGDSWVKLSFMEDYNYPFYRAHLFRYDRADDRAEKCTLMAISTPNSDEARACTGELGIRFFLVNRDIDGPQFDHFGRFSRIFDGPEVSAYFSLPHVTDPSVTRSR